MKGIIVLKIQKTVLLILIKVYLGYLVFNLGCYFIFWEYNFNL